MNDIQQQTDSQITLTGLVEEVDQHVTRIRSAGPTESGQRAMLELSGTILPMFRDIVNYVAMLEQAVIRATEENTERIDQIEEGILSSSQDEGTRFEPEDAASFLEFIRSAKLLVETVMSNPSNPEPVRQQMERMLAEADRLISIVEDGTLEDEQEEDGEDSEDSDDVESEDELVGGSA